MGVWRGRRQQRRLVALAAFLVVVGLPALARSALPGPGRRARAGHRVRRSGATPSRSQRCLPARPRWSSTPTTCSGSGWRPTATFTDPANTPPERDGAPAANVVVKTRLPGRHPQGDRRGRSTTSSPPASLALRVYKAQPALRPLPGRQPDAASGRSSSAPRGTGARPRRSCPAAPRSSSSAGACRTAGSPTGTRPSRWPSATTGTTAAIPTRCRSTSAPPATASCATRWRPGRTPSPPRC